MFMVIVLSALGLTAIVSTVTALRNDGYRRIPTDPTRLDAADRGGFLQRARLV